jgi:hypothetical protein
MLHAKTEEEVLYPAAIVVGEYLKLKLNIKQPGRCYDLTGIDRY